MSREYDGYLQQHIDNVTRGFNWLCDNLIETIPIEYEFTIGENIRMHDASKMESDEYNAYDEYFYGGNRSYQVVENFNKAWLTHIHRNPHHWQHWILINDDPDEGEILLEIPYCYIIEMVCDWWAFSWAKGDLTEIFNWYDDHKGYMKLEERTRKKVESILDAMKEKLLDSESVLKHHGVKGQKWGIRRTKEQLGYDGVGEAIDDIHIRKSVGAKSFNYDIIDPSTGEHFHFSEGTRIRNACVFAGKGGSKPLKPEVANGLSEQLGGEPNKWQHCKGVGTIDYHGEDIDAEVHWFQEESAGKHKFKVKKWMED